MEEKQNIAQILYGAKNQQEQKEKQERNSLLNQLGSSLTNAQVLYSPIDELKKMKQNENKLLPQDKEKYMTIVKNSNNETDERFQEFLKFVYKSEGGFSDNKNDKGGRTNFGITQKTYDWYNQRHKLPLKDVKEITKAESDKIYYDDYYKASGADKIKDKKISYMHFDSAINHGVGTAKRFYREAGDDIEKYYNARLRLYDNLAKDPKQKEFHKGWINRLNRVKNYQ